MLRAYKIWWEILIQNKKNAASITKVAAGRLSYDIQQLNLTHMLIPSSYLLTGDQP
jgi:hypothetical protein